MPTSSIEVIAQSIKDEFFYHESDYRVSQRGLARLIGCSKTAIAGYCQRFNLATLTLSKTLESMQGASLNLATLGSKDALACIRYYAFKSTDITLGVQQQAVNLLDAFAERGYIGWVSNLLQVEADYTKSDAELATLLGLYPGLAWLVQEKAEDNEREVYFTAVEFLKGLGLTGAELLWYSRRLPLRAASTYRSLKQEDPKRRPGISAQGSDCMVISYLESELSILLAAYESLNEQYNAWQQSQGLVWNFSYTFESFGALPDYPLESREYEARRLR